MRKSNNDSGLTARRSNRLLVAVLTALCAVSASTLFAQDHDRLSERTIMGTARYVGMSGAMTAIGGDPSAVLDNPAGLGLYRHHEAMVTFDYTLDKTQQIGRTDVLPGRANLFMVPQGSIVVTVPTDNVTGEGVQFHNLMFCYSRVQTYNREMRAAAAGGNSLGSLFASTGVDFEIPYATDPTNAYEKQAVIEAGAVNKFSFDWAMNISNRWYWGIGLRVHVYSFASEGAFEETFARVNESNVAMYNLNSTSMLLRGVDCSLSTGLIYRPLSWLRLGFGLETPSLGSCRGYSSGYLKALTDSVNISNAPDHNWPDASYHQPLHTSASVAFQIGYYALLAFQYDYWHPLAAMDKHSLRAGLEVIPIPGMYINAGYAYESAFKNTFEPVPLAVETREGKNYLDRQDAYYQYNRWTQYASVALGYRGISFMAQVAYQYRWQQFNLYAHQNVAEPYYMHADTHRIVLTLGWHK